MGKIDLTTQKAHQAVQYFKGVEGMMNQTAAYAFIMLMEAQQEWNITGSIFETGVYKGKSASILCQYANEDDDVILVDIGYQEETKHLNHLHDKNIFVKSKSEEVSENFANFEDYRNKIRVMHADGSHTFSNVLNDLELANQLLKEGGVIILDDFLSPGYPQVQAATYSYIALNPEVFDVFLIGANKAMLCRPEYHKKYINYFLENMIERMSDFDNDIMLSVSDIHKDFDVLGFRDKINNDESSYYLERLYKKLYEMR